MSDDSFENILVKQYQPAGNRIKRDAIVGGLTEIPTDDTTVKALIEQTLTQLDADSGSDNRLIAKRVISATRQVVAGALYRIKIEMVTSDCGKNKADGRDGCNQLEGETVRVCDVEVWDRPWITDGTGKQVGKFRAVFISSD